MNFAAVEHEMDAAVARGVFPGVVVLVNIGGQVVFHRAAGMRALEPERSPMREDTIFDLASLTKPLATSLAMMIMLKERKIGLDDRVSRFFHNFGVHGKTHVTFRHLLANTSGLPAWRPYWKDILRIEREGRINFTASRGAKEYVYEAIQREKPDAAAGAKTLYSDLGFMLLGAVVEEVNGTTLDRYCHERIYKPLGLRATSYVDLSLLRTRRLEPIADMIAPTERCPWRKRVLCGEVHDDNAFAMGGVAGHAGLFSSARDIDRIATVLRECYDGQSLFLPAAIVREFWRRNDPAGGSTWALGWDTPSQQDSTAGSELSRHSVGHVGFTGTSLWIDLERGMHVVVLSNRVHPSRDNDKIREFRPLIHDLIVRAATAAS
ncbi:MAG: beta-lactamase family protein [Deltaproteobacteria bacterium]|nr:MAG: beta-lactamase family protein [Deltaproteobacteria bacterium]